MVVSHLDKEGNKTTPQNSMTQGKSVTCEDTPSSSEVRVTLGASAITDEGGGGGGQLQHSSYRLMPMVMALYYVTQGSTHTLATNMRCITDATQ